LTHHSIRRLIRPFLRGAEPTSPAPRPRQGDQGRREPSEELTHALSHPLRLRILEISAHERGRTLSVASLTGALTATREYEHVTAGQVNYHRTRLLNAGLILTY
jgi:DNA-binding transcriptional ArsR family regulator